MHIFHKSVNPMKSSGTLKVKTLYVKLPNYDTREWQKLELLNNLCGSAYIKP